MKRAPDEDQVATILKFGSYNCALVIDGTRVARVSVYNNGEREKSLRDLKRAGSILSQFKKHADILGPCVLHELEAGREMSFNELQQAYSTNVLKQILSCGPIATVYAQYPNFKYHFFYVQEIEYGVEGDLLKFMMKDEFDFEMKQNFMFFLMWFFYVAQAQFGFRHRDLKLENIIVRKYNEPKTFRFQLDNTVFHTITTRFVPVVIDLDFGSFYNTNHATRNQMGTPTSMPPERLLEELRRQENVPSSLNIGASPKLNLYAEEEDLDDDDDGALFDLFTGPIPHEHVPQDNATVDWYSIGSLMLELFCKTRLLGAYSFDNRNFFNMIARDAPHAKNTPSYTLALQRACVIEYALGMPSALSIVAEAAKQTRLFESNLAKRQIRKIRETLDTVPDTRSLLQRLMNPHQHVRIDNGDPWNILQDAAANSFRATFPRKRGAGTVIAYGRFPIMDVLDEDSVRFKELRDQLEYIPHIGQQQVCVSCGTDTQYQCACECQQWFCSAMCQSKFEH